jgi:hypothetical protein
MNESVWVCERCGKEYNLEMGEAWVVLTEEIPLPEHGKLSPIEPYEAVCYECADDLLAIVEQCDKDCMHCDATQTWGLSINDCVRFQLKFDLLEPARPQGKVNFMGCLYDAEVVLAQFKSLWPQRELS